MSLRSASWKRRAALRIVLSCRYRRDGMDGMASFRHMSVPANHVYLQSQTVRNPHVEC